jgi:DNA-binding transcriptional MocR family regulator
VFGYGLIREERIQEGVERLASVIAELHAGAGTS